MIDDKMKERVKQAMDRECQLRTELAVKIKEFEELGIGGFKVELDNFSKRSDWITTIEWYKRSYSSGYELLIYSYRDDETENFNYSSSNMPIEIVAEVLEFWPRLLEQYCERIERL